MLAPGRQTTTDFLIGFRMPPRQTEDEASRRKDIMDAKPYEPPTFTEHLEGPRPAILYHYTTQTGLVGIVKSGELWAKKFNI
jgi:hypothetical protein